MANRDTHVMVGAMTGVFVSCLDNDSTSAVNPLVASAVGGFFGRLPDLLEPATSPNHRQFLHGFVFLGGLYIGLKKTIDWKPDNDFDKVIRAVMLIGGGAYISHLALDSMTKKSLPIF